jgi:hypothetical protein
VCLWGVAATAWAQEIGTAIEAEGTVELVRSGSRTPLAIGAIANTGDEIRTGKPGRAVLVFDDDSVLVMGDDSHVRIDEHDFRPSALVVRSRLQLLQGRLRALVGERYRTANATYEVQTPTAFAVVQGTEFVMAYDPVAEVTDVVGVSNTVRVQSATDRAARGAVLVNPQELTTVAKGELPIPPHYIPDVRFRSYLEGLEFIGAGRPESLTARTVLAGKDVPPREQAEAFPGPFVLSGEPGDLPVRPRTPGDILGESPVPAYYGPSSLGNVGVGF